MLRTVAHVPAQEDPLVSFGNQLFPDQNRAFQWPVATRFMSFRPADLWEKKNEAAKRCSIWHVSAMVRAIADFPSPS